MLAKRVLVVAILLPAGLLIIFLGGWVFAGFVALVLGLAAWEFGQLFRLSGFQPAIPVLALGATALTRG